MAGCSKVSAPMEDNATHGCGKSGSCGTGGCNKLNSFDWLADMELPETERFDVVEVRFKNGRKEFFRNSHKLQLYSGDPVIVDVPNGHHLGHVALQGELVRLQMLKKKVVNDENIRSIYRIATQKDISRFEELCNRESPALYRTREIILGLKLSMKLTDVEFQSDGTKATFYYSADERVDFRELIKLLAAEFKVRVEMRQISLRQEASRLGGIGSCGRELCCSTWLTEFKSVTTTAARYQNLSLNPGKLSGQCGRLKCCLNYELETYMEALKDIPNVEAPLKTQQGEARLQKTDIFRRLMWFGYENDNTWVPIPVERVNEIIELNKKDQKPVSLLENEPEQKEEAGQALNSDLDQLDRKYKNRANRRNKKKKRRNQNPDTGN
jgi:cell fate regulator YaaT (PSP1 superfamily)